MKKFNNKGFTLIELLVVVAIIGILAAVGVVAYNGYTASAKVNATNINNKIINKGFSTYTSTKNVEVIKITTPTIKVFVAPAPTKAKTVSKVDIGAAKIS